MNYTGTDVLEIMQEAKNYNKYLFDLIESSLRGTKILDFGAGLGQFALPLIEKGHQIYCLEPDPHQRNYLMEKGLKVFSNIDEITETFDTIYSINVLEHIENDKEIVQKLTSHLSNNGRLLLYVPAFSILYSTFDRKIGHMRRYSKNTIRPLVNNLKTIDFRYVDSLGFLAALVYKILSNPQGNVSPRAVHIYDRYLFPMSLLFDKFFKFYFGKNVFYLGEKNSSDRK